MSINDALTYERLYSVQTLILDKKQMISPSTLQIACCSKFPNLALLLIHSRDEYDFSKSCYLGFDDEAMNKAILTNNYELVEKGFLTHFPELKVHSEFYCGNKKIMRFLKFAVREAMMEVVSCFFANYEFLKRKNVYRECFIQALRCESFTPFETAIRYFIDRMSHIKQVPDVKSSDLLLLSEIEREFGLSKEDILYHLLSETDDDLFLQKCDHILQFCPSLFVRTNYDIDTERKRRMKNLGF